MSAASYSTFSFRLMPQAGEAERVRDRMLVVAIDGRQVVFEGPFADNKPVRVPSGSLHVTHCLWFADVKGADGVVAQQLLACACPGSRASSTTLVDVTGTTQGDVELGGGADGAHPLVPDATSKQWGEWIRAVERVRAHDVFARVVVFAPGGTADLPLLWYPCLAYHQVHRHWPAHHDPFEAWWPQVQRFVHPTQTSDADLLADLLAWPSHGWIYRPDVLRGGQPTDCWSSLWAYPASGSAPLAFDCDDGAHALLHLFWHLQRVPTPRDPTLQRLQALARTYDPWLAIAEIKVGPKCYPMHCLVVLLPHTGQGSRAITLESTIWASGAWPSLQPAGSCIDLEVYERSHRALDHIPAGVRAHARLRSPVSMAYAQRMYGRLVSLFGVTEAGRAQHWVLEKDLDLGDFLVASGDLATRAKGAARLVIDVPHAAMEAALQPMLGAQPRSACPRPPLASASSSPPFPCAALLVPRSIATGQAIEGTDVAMVRV